MINTSYFAKYKGNDGVSIARYCKFWKGETCAELYPSESLLHWWKSLTKEQQDSKEYQDKYTESYTKQLDLLDVNEIGNRLQGKVLLCYEKTGSFCHRHIVSEWLNSNNIECSEL